MPKKRFSFQPRQPDAALPAADPDIQRFISGAPAPITRKTIALPEASFTRVKVEAAKRGVPAYQLWGEIVDTYFRTHPE
jgi:hypothetical protein